MHPKVYEAVKLGDFNVLTTILGNQEDLLQERTPNGNNILHVAAQYKKVNLLGSLLESPLGQPLLSQGNSKGDTPLHIAATQGSLEVAQVFINLAKLLNDCEELLRKSNSRGDTVMHHAVRGGHKSMVELLIKEDPQLYGITNAANESPLYLAMDRRHLDIIELILNASSLPISHNGPKGSTALHVAIGRRLTGWECMLKDWPELIREQDENGWTLLHHAAARDEVKTVQELLQHDISAVYHLSKERQSALHIAAFLGYQRVIDEIVKLCPDAWDLTNKKGQTALHEAAMGGQVHVVKYILRMPNLEYLIKEQDIDGNTALHVAALHKKYSIIYNLARDKKVDCFTTNNDHKTALDIFSAHDEVGYHAAKVSYLLKRSYGMPAYRDWFIKQKELDKQFVEGKPAHTRMSINSVIQLQLIVAGLIATGTFAAAFTMPGGHDNDGSNQGSATLAGRAAFQAFVISNSTAFGFSMLALVLQCLTIFEFSDHQARYTPLAGCFISIAILAMVLAFGCGSYAVLTRHIWLAIFPFVLFGCLLNMYFIGLFLDPHTSGVRRRFWARRARNFLFDLKMFSESC